MPVKLVVFDFDLTLSTIHMYHALAGTAQCALGEPPYATSERGQLARIAELDASAMHRGQQCSFSVAVLGGRERVAKLRGFFAELRAAGAECVICTRGLVGAVRKCLQSAGLLEHFSQVYGNIGDINGNTEYDLTVAQTPLGPGEGQLLGTEATSMQAAARSKQLVVARLMKERGLTPDEVVFVDDTWEEIQSMIGTCPTIQVVPPQGLGQREIDLLLSVLQADGGSRQLAALGASSAGRAASTPAKGEGLSGGAPSRGSPCRTSSAEPPGRNGAHRARGKRGPPRKSPGRAAVAPSWGEKAAGGQWRDRGFHKAAAGERSFPFPFAAGLEGGWPLPGKGFKAGASDPTAPSLPLAARGGAGDEQRHNMTQGSYHIPVAGRARARLPELGDILMPSILSQEMLRLGEAQRMAGWVEEDRTGFDFEATGDSAEYCHSSSSDDDAIPHFFRIEDDRSMIGPGLGVYAPKQKSNGLVLRGCCNQ